METLQELRCRFPQDAAVLLELAQALGAVGERAAALSVLERLQREDPSHAGALRLQIDMLAAEGRTTEALAATAPLSSPTTPTPLELYPALAFDRLFKDEASPADKSVLDAVLADAQDLRRAISSHDQRKLDEYLDSVREVEKRIENAGKRGELQGWRPTLDKPNMQRPADGIPQDIAEHMRLMCDILVLGFQTDTTRITTLKLNNDHSALRFPNLPSVQQPGHGIDYMIHHLLSHSDGEDYLKVNQLFMEQLAYLARKMDSIREGDRTLLDNTMLMHCSSMMVGAKHNNDELPIIVLGGAGGRLKSGRVLDYKDKPERQLCRLFMSMMDKMDVRPKTFGDAKLMLEEV